MADANPQDANPFASPSVSEAPPPPPEVGEMADAERIRREYLSREASVRSEGSLFMLGAALFGLAAVGWAIPLVTRGVVPDLPSGHLVYIAVLAFMVVLVVAHGWIGYGLRRLNPAARPWAIIFSVLWLLYFPVGTVFSPYVIFLLTGRKARYIMTPEYRAIRAATPHIRYKTPVWLWVLVACIVLFVATLIAVALLLGR